MLSGTPIRRSPAAAIEFLLGTRMQAKSGACHRKQRPGSLSTRYTKGVPIAHACKINRQPELIESCVSRSKQSPLPKINRQLFGTRSFRLRALRVPCHLLALSAREGSLATAFLIETPPRIEIPVTYSYERRKHFLIETRNGISRFSLHPTPKTLHPLFQNPLHALDIGGNVHTYRIVFRFDHANAVAVLEPTELLQFFHAFQVT